MEAFHGVFLAAQNGEILKDTIQILSTGDVESAAAQAGLMSYDTIVRADGEAVTGVDDLIRPLNRARIDRAIAIDVLRRGQLLSR